MAMLPFIWPRTISARSQQDLESSIADIPLKTGFLIYSRRILRTISLSIMVIVLGGLVLSPLWLQYPLGNDLRGGMKHARAGIIWSR